MDIRERIVSSLGGVTKKELEERINEAIDFASATGEDEPTKYGYRGYGQALRDLLAGKHAMALEAVWRLYVSNPLADRLLKLQRDFIVGEGITYTANDEKVQEILDAFWTDSVNNFDLWVDQMPLELALWGEQIYPVFIRTGDDVGSGDGRVRCGVIDPKRVRKVVTDPENARIKTEVHVVGPGNKTLKYKIIQRDEDPNSETRGRLVGLPKPEKKGETKGDEEEGDYQGACFYFSVNGLSNSTRGIPDLLAHTDWLDQYDQYLFNVLEREALIKAFIWDVLVEGADEAKLRAKAQSEPPPKPGSVKYHNEREKWAAVVPDLKEAGSEIAGRQVLTHIVGTFGFPRHWFGEGESATRATAKEMGEPTLKSLSSRQRYFKYMLQHMMEFVIDQASIAGKLEKGIDREFKIHMPDISVRDTNTAAQALLETAQALLLAQQNNWISLEKAIEVFAQVAAQLGVEIDVQEMMEAKGPERETPGEDYGGNGQPHGVPQGGALKEAMKIVERISAGPSS